MFIVTNTNDFDFTGTYDGVDYLFPAGTKVSSPDSATIHIFGLAEENKVPTYARHGWVRPTDPASVGDAILAKFSFEHIKPEYGAPAARIDHRPAPVSYGQGAEASASAPAGQGPLPGSKRAREAA